MPSLSGSSEVATVATLRRHAGSVEIYAFPGRGFEGCYLAGERDAGRELPALRGLRASLGSRNKLLPWVRSIAVDWVYSTASWLFRLERHANDLLVVGSTTGMSTYVPRMSRPEGGFSNELAENS